MAYVGTETPLGSGETYTSARRERQRFDRVAGSVYSDTAGTLYIEQSSNGTNWDVSSDYPVTAANGAGFEESLVAPFWRIRFVNSAANQTAFRLHATTQADGDS